MATNLAVSKTSDALAYLTTPLTPLTSLTPWGFSPQAERLLSLFFEFSSFFPTFVPLWNDI